MVTLRRAVALAGSLRRGSEGTMRVVQSALACRNAYKCVLSPFLEQVASAFGVRTTSSTLEM